MNNIIENVDHKTNAWKPDAHTKVYNSQCLLSFIDSNIKCNLYATVGHISFFPKWVNTMFNAASPSSSRAPKNLQPVFHTLAPQLFWYFHNDNPSNSYKTTGSLACFKKCGLLFLTCVRYIHMDGLSV